MERFDALPASQERDERAAPPPAESAGAAYSVALSDASWGDPTTFYEHGSANLIRQAIAEVVATEAPISLALLSRRVAARWAFGRATARAQRRVEDLMEGMALRVVDDAGRFVWSASMDPREYAGFRYSSNIAEQRDAEDIPLPEVANAAHEILQRSIKLPADDLVRETARAFGFQRTGARVSARMRQGIRRLVEGGHAEARDADIVLVD